MIKSFYGDRRVYDHAIFERTNWTTGDPLVLVKPLYDSLEIRCRGQGGACSLVT